MRIAYFTDTYYPEINGVTNTLSHLHTYLNQHRIEHIFISPEYQGEAPEDGIYRFRGFPIPFSPNSRLAVPNHRDIVNKIKAFHPDLIHVVTEFTIGSEGARTARELGIPLVMSYHTNIDQYLEFFHAKILERPVREFFKRFHDQALLNLCPSVQTLLQLKAQNYQHLDIWSRGVDTRLYSPEKRKGQWRKQFPGKFLCLYAGRLSFEKGLDTYLEAIRRINAHRNDMEFLFAGDGPMGEELENCGIPNVRLLGFLRGETLAELYADSDLFVFPSGTETFGNVLLEAMASGLPCICTDSGGVTDFAVNDVNARMTPFRSSSRLAEAVLELAEESVKRERLSAGALETAKDRSWEKVMDGLMDSYETVLRAIQWKSA